MITRWNDLDRMIGAMDLLRGRMNRLFTDFDRSWGMEPGWGADSLPRVNLYDTGEALEFISEVPGLGKDDLNVRIQGNYLEISGSWKSDRPEGYAVHRVERGTNSFTRSFTLPLDVNAEKVEATLKKRHPHPAAAQGRGGEAQADHH